MSSVTSSSAGHDQASLSPREKRDLNVYKLQVRAFVNAAEEVDADPDTIEDILDGFEESGEDAPGYDIETPFTDVLDLIDIEIDLVEDIIEDQDQDPGDETEYDIYLREGEESAVPLKPNRKGRVKVRDSRQDGLQTLFVKSICEFPHRD